LAHGNCQFNNCTHRDEPNCVVRGDWERYEHYLDFLADAMVWQQQLNSQPNPENSLKRKSRSGTKQFEPKLDSKYRQISRHTIVRSLDAISDEMD
jgi:ribosome biogenesis GTPase / thiamine phosphate phosphatase